MLQKLYPSSANIMSISICWMLNEMSLDRVEGNLRELIRSLLANTVEEKLRKGNTEVSFTEQNSFDTYPHGLFIFITK